MLQPPLPAYNIYFSPTIESLYYCSQRDSNHIFCNFSTKFHSSNLIIVLTFPFPLACTLPNAPVPSLTPPVPSLTPPVPAKRHPVCDALSFKPRHLPTRWINHAATQSLFQIASIPTLPVTSFIHNLITNHFYSKSLSLKPI